MENNNGMRFKSNTNKSNTYCSVFGCKSHSSKDAGLSFHTFPKPGSRFVDVETKLGTIEKTDQLKAWEMALKMGKPVTKHMRVCSLHFVKDDYLMPDSDASKRFLKKCAVPSCNLPKNSVEISGKEKMIDAEKRNNERGARRTARELLKAEALTNKSIVDGNNRRTEEKIETNEVTSSIGIEEDELPACFRDIGIQVCGQDFTQNFCDIIKTDENLSTLTGVPSFQLLDSIVEIVSRQLKEGSNTKLGLRDRIVMTFMKFKQNLSYAMLAILFQCYTPQNCSKIIIRIIDILSACLQVAIPWPSRDEISQNVPNCFSDFSNVRVILDCTEISIERPKNLCCQITTYSHYKGTNTIKFMTGVTPGGLISFVSKSYGGRSSDKAIFEQSGIMQLLEKNDAVMVDKGFLIDEICLEHGIVIVRPPFLKNQKQLPKTEALLNNRIARARVHIERANQRLKAFKILGDKMPVRLIKQSEKIFKIICAIVNLSAPIMKDDKFNSKT